MQEHENNRTDRYTLERVTLPGPLCSRTETVEWGVS